MEKNTFKFSALALSIFAVTNAHAALYKIEEISENANESYGVALSEGGLAGVDTREGSDGFPFKEEAPFAFDNRFRIIEEDQNSQRDLYYYCRDERGYKTCENWAYTQWYGINGKGGLRAEREAYYNGYSSNAKAFVNGSQLFGTAPNYDTSLIDGTFESNSTNTVVTGFAAETPIGTTSSGYYESNGTYRLGYRERGFYGNQILLPAQNDGLVEKMGRSMAFDSFELGGTTYIVGSASVQNFDTSDNNKDYGGNIDDCVTASKPSNLRQCQHVAFATKPYIWDTSATAEPYGLPGKPVASWGGDSSVANRNSYTAIGSVRGAAISERTAYNGEPVLVGYNKVRPNGDNNLGMQAGVFFPKDTFDINSSEPWRFVSISGAEIYNGDDYIFSNSRATDINTSLVAIGEAKLRNNRALNGALANRLFWTNANTSNPSAKFFTGGIFFSGAGGTASAINNYNEIVGSIDAETDREDGGKQRRRRGFIYPLGNVNGVSGPVSDEMEERFARLNNKAWWVDDLTDSNDSIGAANNEFRIIDVGAIDDSGNMVATAIKCEGGYDTRSHNSYCGGGTQTEKVVAVKLTPLTGSENTGISPRGGDSSPVERQGAGLGLWILALFGILGFRKRQ